MKLWIKWLFHERKSWKKGRMTSTLSSLAQPTGLHCPGAGGWLSPSDLLELLTLITALCPHTVQMGPFVGLPWSSGVRGRGRAGGSRRGLPGGFTLSFKEGGETPKHRAQKRALFRKAERESTSIASIVQLALWLEYIIIWNSRADGPAVWEMIQGQRKGTELGGFVWRPLKESLSRIARVGVMWPAGGCQRPQTSLLSFCVQICH